MRLTSGLLATARRQRSFKIRSGWRGGDVDGEDWTTAFLTANASRSDVWSTLDGKRWTQVTAEAPWVGRFGHCLTVFKGKLWLIGGYHRESETAGENYLLNDVWRSSDGLHWTSITQQAPWTPRYYHQTVAFRDKLWLIGGQYDEEHGDLSRDIWSSSDGKTWTRVTGNAPWSMRYGEAFGAFVLPANGTWRKEDAICVIAPSGLRSPTGVDLLSNGVWLSTDGVNWKMQTDAAPFHQFSYAAVFAQSRMFVYGGRSQRQGDRFAQVWASSDGREWGLESSTPAWGAREMMRAVCLKNTVYLLGGNHTNEVWSSSDPTMRKWTRLKLEQPRPSSSSEAGRQGEEFRISKNPSKSR